MNKSKTNTIIIFAENKPGVLYRIANTFLRRKINIESLSVSETDIKGISCFIITVSATNDIVVKIVKQCNKIIEVTKVIAN